MSDRSDSRTFHWQRQAHADRIIDFLSRQFLDRHAVAKKLAGQLHDETGTRWRDWIDHIAVGVSLSIDGKPMEASLSESGFEIHAEDESGRWYFHHGGLFPRFCLSKSDSFRIALQVESVADFLAAGEFEVPIEGKENSCFRRALVDRRSDVQLYACERHGWTDWRLCNSSDEQIELSRRVMNTFNNRSRESFDDAAKTIAEGVSAIGVDWACDLFFAAEREYWQSRNRAAQIQKQRQDYFGLGWGNHDHHTYRSSRQNFASLIRCLEMLGFQCRERFYAGGQAGWGAQVLEQANTGVVIFADVDLSPDELSGDFAHEGLAASNTLGTVGLWCQLHGEAFLEAGMHHLECQFDFDAARAQLAQCGVETMAPFTDFEYLRQAFTKGEVWLVDPGRIDQALGQGWISAEQAEKFRREGAVGSHLEILERNEGFKGFNQTGVSEIIRKTDPREL